MIKENGCCDFKGIKESLNYRLEDEKKRKRHMISITEYLEHIYEDFKRQIDTGEWLCDIKKLSFEAGGLPDYSNIQIQRLYLLRYAFAYGFEYTQMYKEVLQDMDDPTEIRVTSIGCGNMIDYWALVQAVECKWWLDCKIKYVGIDEIEWAYKFEKRPQDVMRYDSRNAKTCFSETGQLASDVYFFPKSISEFTGDEMRDIAEAFRTKPIVKNTIYLCISLRKNEHSHERDIQRTKQIYDALLENGFKANQNYDRYAYYPQNPAIFTCDNNYRYPNDATEYLLHLNEKCINYVNEGENCDDDCIYLNRKPTLRTGNINYQVIKFERM